MKFSRTKRAPQTGFTLIEILVVLVIIGILVTIVVKGFGLTDDAKAVAAAEETKYGIAKIQSCHNSSSDFTGLTSEIALGRCGAFKDRVTGAVGTLAVTNSFGGTRAFAPASLAGGTNNAFTLAEPQIPYSSCQSFVDLAWKNANRIDIGATNVKATNDQVIAPNAIYAACGTAGAVTVVFTAGKGGY